MREEEEPEDTGGRGREKKKSGEAKLREGSSECKSEKVSSVEYLFNNNFNFCLFM